MLVVSVATMRDVSRAAPAGSTRIDVVGYQFWWSVRYPDADVTVANELHIPVGEPVEVRLTSDDVIHSFWAPELHGKLDLLPDGTNTLVLEAERAGVYGGECAEFCGIQHTNMGFVVVAEPPDAVRRMACRSAAAGRTGRRSGRRAVPVRGVRRVPRHRGRDGGVGRTARP